jgi:23S rRNA-/tRNA-specific pseudouridylate synthase
MVASGSAPKRRLCGHCRRKLSSWPLVKKCTGYKTAHLLLSTRAVHVVAKRCNHLSVPGVYSVREPSVACLLASFLWRGGPPPPPPSSFPPTASHLIVHRLDYGTSGLLLLAATAESSSALSAAFRASAISKTYEAVLDARCLPAASPLLHSQCGEVSLPLGKRHGIPLLHTHAPFSGGLPTALKAAVTRWVVLERGAGAVRVELVPLTGRTHQLRLHCAVGLGAPIVGDALYGAVPAGASFAEELAGRAGLQGQAEVAKYIAGARGAREATRGLPPMALPSCPQLQGLHPWRLCLHARDLRVPGAVLFGGAECKAEPLETGYCSHSWLGEWSATATASGPGGLIDARGLLQRGLAPTHSLPDFTVQVSKPEGTVLIRLRTPF